MDSNKFDVMKRYLILMALTILILKVNAQESKDSELFKTLQQQDSIFFEKSFNQCDLKYLEESAHKDLVFFHDQGGMQDRSKFIDNVKKYICGNKDQKPIRKPVSSSLEVFPLYSEGKLYGVIQTGVHDFFLREKGKPDVYTNRAKFSHVWLLENGKWLLREVLSYDHKEPAAIEETKTVEYLNPSTISTPKGYSHAAKFDIGNSMMIIISGQVALDNKGNLVGKNDLQKQTEQVFTNIKNILESAGGKMSDLVKISIYMKDVNDIQKVRDIRDKFIDLKNPPASTLVEVSSLFREDILIEIEATAIVSKAK
jgi:reactive intermediate/imine deaminase